MILSTFCCPSLKSLEPRLINDIFFSSLSSTISRLRNCWHFTRNWFVLLWRDCDSLTLIFSQAPYGWALVRLICMKIVTKILTIQVSHGSKPWCLWINIANDRGWEYDRVFEAPLFRGLAGVWHISTVFSSAISKRDIKNVLLTLKSFVFVLFVDCRFSNKEKETVKRTRNKLIDLERDKRMLEIPNGSDYMIGLLMSL